MAEEQEESAEGHEGPPGITITPPADMHPARPRTFQKLEEFTAWFRKEQEYWSWLNSKPVSAKGELNAITNAFSRAFNQIDQKLNASDGHGIKSALVDDLRRETQEQLDAWNFVDSSSAAAFRVKQAREDEDNVIAAAILASLCKKPATGHDPAILWGTMSARFFLLGVDPEGARSQREALETLGSDFATSFAANQERITDLEARGAQYEAKMADQSKEFDKARQGKIEEFDGKIADWEEQAKQQRKNHLVEFESIQQIYHDAMALSEAVEYWRKKREHHRQRTRIWALAFVDYVLIVIVFGYIGVRDTQIWSSSFWAEATYGLIALALVGIGLFSAVARVLLRLSTSQLHLGNDALERVTMVQTYLALREGGHATDSHMQVVLERLFDRAADGIVREDLGPVTPVENLRRIFGGS